MLRTGPPRFYLEPVGARVTDSIQRTWLQDARFVLLSYGISTHPYGWVRAAEI